MDDDDEIIGKLRRENQLTTTPDGREAVPVTVQFRGELPNLPRAERKIWLNEKFEQIGRNLDHVTLDHSAYSISLSGQTINATCSVDELDALRKEAAGENLRIDIARDIQAAED